MKKRGIHKQTLIFLILLILISILIQANINTFIKEQQPDINNQEIKLSDLSLRQKIAQMLLVYAKLENKDWIINNNIGGIWMPAQETYTQFKSKIDYFQSDAKIKLLIAVDLEGCINPFANFQEFQNFNQIKTPEQSFNLGKQHGEFLKNLGVNINFGPVVDLEDNIWNCRSFNGTPEEIAEKANHYIKGLHKFNILSSVKHYPGRTLEAKDPHMELLYAEIREIDVLPFLNTLKNTDSIMVGHQITTGLLNSQGKPATTSNIVDHLSNQFDGLIFSDEIGMLGLRKFYDSDYELYLDLFRVKNDVILIFHTDTRVLDNFIDTIENAVKKQQIEEDRIDNSVKKILIAKGYKVVD